MQDFCDWIEDPEHGFYVREVWDDEKNAWIGPGKLRLRDFQKRIFKHCLSLGPDGKFPYETILLSMPKKSGKTAIAAAIEAWYAEQLPDESYLFCIANDEEQAEGLVMGDIRFHAKELGLRTLKGKVEYPNGTSIQALAQNYKTVAGTRHAMTVWDELWGYCQPKKTKILRNDLTWVNSEDLQVGDEIVAFESEKSGAHVYRSWQKGKVISTGLRTLPCVSVSLQSGKTISGTVNHKWLAKIAGRHEIVWVEAQNLRQGDQVMRVLDVWGKDNSFEAGYLSGAFDGEGSLHHPKGGGVRFDFAQRENQMRDKVIQILSDKNIKFSDTGKTRTCKNIEISKKADILRLLGSMDFCRLKSKLDIDRLGRMTALGWDAVVGVSPIYDEEVVALTTTTETYVADGYCSHNTSEQSRRAWDELTPIPTVPNSLRIIATYAGFENESDLLWDLYLQGVGTDENEKGQGKPIPELEDLPCWSNGSLFTYWDHEPRMPWQTDAYYEGQRKSLRPSAFLRLHTNSWTSTNEEFLPIEWWDRACKAFERPADQDPQHPFKSYPVTISVDAAPKRDCTAISGWTHDSVRGKTIMLFNRIWTPVKGEDFDLEATVEAYILEKSKSFNVVSVVYDPRDLHQTMTRLRSRGLPCNEYVQQQENMIRCSQALYDALKYDNIEAYPDDEWRKHMQMATAEDSPRGFRIVKEKGNRKSHIDGAISTAMGVYDAIHRSEVHSGEEIRVHSPFSDTSVWDKPNAGPKLPWQFME